MDKREVKSFGGYVVETKEEQRNGEPVGLVSGYMATWDLDRGSFGVRDRFVKGAFLESLNDHRLNRNRQVRFKDNHGEVVGGFPISGVHEDEVGLFGTAEINLKHRRGGSLFSLIKQGVIVDFSVGFAAIDFNTETEDEDEVRNITKARLFEASAVGEPMNPKAIITDVKSLGERFEKAIRINPSLNDDEIDEILEELKSIEIDIYDEGLELVKPSDIEPIEDLKNLEKLLKKQGFSNDAATKFIGKAHELKTRNQGELGDGENNGDDQGELDNQKVIKLVKSMNSELENSKILHKLKQIKR